MVMRSLLFSLILSLVSLLFVGAIPIDVPVKDEAKVYSPYREEIDTLLEKGKNEMRPSEFARLNRLIKRNNEWFDKNIPETPEVTASDALDAWKEKSAYLAPLIMVVWGVGFLLFCRREVNIVSLMVLVFPVVLTIVGLMPLLEFVLVAVSVFAIWFWFQPAGRLRS